MYSVLLCDAEQQRKRVEKRSERDRKEEQREREKAVLVYVKYISQFIWFESDEKCANESGKGCKKAD